MQAGSPKKSGTHALSYKNESTTGNDGEEDNKLDAFGLWTRVIFCPIIVPTFFCFALCFGVDPDAQIVPTSDTTLPSEMNTIVPLTRSEKCINFLCPCLVSFEIEGDQAGDGGNSMLARKKSIKIQPKDLEKARIKYALATNIARTDRFVSRQKGYWDKNVFYADPGEETLVDDASMPLLSTVDKGNAPLQSQKKRVGLLQAIQSTSANSVAATAASSSQLNNSVVSLDSMTTAVGVGVVDSAGGDVGGGAPVKASESPSSSSSSLFDATKKQCEAASNDMDHVSDISINETKSFPETTALTPISEVQLLTMTVIAENEHVDDKLQEMVIPIVTSIEVEALDAAIVKEMAEIETLENKPVDYSLLLVPKSNTSITTTTTTNNNNNNNNNKIIATTSLSINQTTTTTAPPPPTTTAALRSGTDLLGRSLLSIANSNHAPLKPVSGPSLAILTANRPMLNMAYDKMLLGAAEGEYQSSETRSIGSMGSLSQDSSLFMQLRHGSHKMNTTGQRINNDDNDNNDDDDDNDGAKQSSMFVGSALEVIDV